jgi:Protein of unknown function (DUF1460).
LMRLMGVRSDFDFYTDMKKQHFVAILFLAAAPIVGAQSADSAIFEQKRRLAQQGGALAAKTLHVAKSFLNVPYVSGTLEQPGEERLVVNFEQLDCWTFVENSVALALSESGSFLDFKRHLQQLRYWGGNLDGYGSRIHYFTGWLLQAEKRGLLQDISKDLGGEPYQPNISYISNRPNKYPRIKDPETLRDIRAAERRINAHKWYYIPQDRVAQMEHLIQEGDIISLTAWKPDLDIAHQGFAVKVNGRIHLMHASSLAKKVIVSKQPLPDYLLSQRGQTGIMVARMK